MVMNSGCGGWICAGENQFSKQSWPQWGTFQHLLWMNDFVLFCWKSLMEFLHPVPWIGDFPVIVPYLKPRSMKRNKNIWKRGGWGFSGVLFFFKMYFYFLNSLPWKCFSLAFQGGQGVFLHLFSDFPGHVQSVLGRAVLERICCFWKHQQEQKPLNLRQKSESRPQGHQDFVLWRQPWK